MSVFSLHLGAPSHAVEPLLLAQRLPTLAAALQGFCHAQALNNAPPIQASTVHLYAAQLGIQRDHITLESLPTLSAAQRIALQALAAQLVDESASDGLVFTPTQGAALGTLNVQAALPPAANFIGRDIAKALPRDEAARVLRQCVNAAQMALHQAPLAACAVNSLWCANALPSNMLAETWLRSGLTAWWDALPAWDAALDTTALAAATQLELIYSDTVLSLPLKRRAAWALWAKPLALSTLLNH